MRLDQGGCLQHYLLVFLLVRFLLSLRFLDSVMKSEQVSVFITGLDLCQMRS